MTRKQKRKTIFYFLVTFASLTTFAVLDNIFDTNSSNNTELSTNSSNNTELSTNSSNNTELSTNSSEHNTTDISSSEHNTTDISSSELSTTCFEYEQNFYDDVAYSIELQSI